jgi:hypothetical protein
MKREPTKYERLHWSLFNIFGKVIGYSFIFGGAVLTVFYSTILFDKIATIDVNGEPTTDIVVKIICAGLPLLVVFSGFLLVKARKWYPRDVRKWFEEKK